jgi:hypothetical protein
VNARRIFAFAALAALAPRDAHAWDSDCGGCEAGPPASTHPWTGPAVPPPDDPHNNEHGDLLTLAMEQAELPSALLEPIDLPVFTATDGSIVGSPLMAAMSVTHHQRRISEFALLPDQGFSLWDWALGFEQCPVDVPFLADFCHKFVGYGGVLNANHFLPQARSNYVHYHLLALDVARSCREMADANDGKPDGLPYVLQCEQQALVVEAVGQHFLQDAWSAGHMWSRWGGPDLGDLPSVQQGAIVAAVAGLVHGSRSITTFDDLMSAPDPSHNIQYREQNADGAIFEMVGDLYLPDLLGSATYAVQRGTLFECSTSGLLEVYRASGANHSGGDYNQPTVDPTSDYCFGQRATNRALFRGFDDIELAQIVVVILDLAGDIIDPQPEPPTPPNELRVELATMRLRLELAASDDPFGTNMASGDIGPLQGVDINNAFLRSPPASYSDDAFRDWNASPTGDAERSTSLTRIFHRGNATAWCESVESGDLDALRERSVHEGGVAKEVCIEFAQRHIEYKRDEEEEEEEEDEEEEQDDDLLPTPRICDESDEQPEEEQPAEEQPEEGEEEEGDEESEEEKYPKSLCHRIARGSAPIIELERLENGPKENAYEMADRWCSKEPEEDEEEDQGAPPDIGYPQDECEPPDDDDDGGDPPEPNPGDDWGSGFGDPHMRTFDGLAYDMHARGEFVLVRTPNGLFEAQIRTRRADDTPFQCDNVGIIDGLALRLGAQRFTVQHEGGSFVARLDGQIIGIGTRTLVDGSVLTVKGRRWYVTRPDGAVVYANTTQSWMHVFVSPAAADRGLLRGLLGDGNGSIGDDLRNASGTLVGSMVNGNFEHTSNELYVGFIQTWFVTGAASLFDHAPGEQPASYAKLGDKPGLACDYDGMMAARNQCRAHGVPTAWELACALDVKLAGTDMLGAFDDVGPATQTRNRSVCTPTPYGDNCACVPNPDGTGCAMPTGLTTP